MKLRNAFHALEQICEHPHFMRYLMMGSLLFGLLWVSMVQVPLESDMANYHSWGQTFAETGQLPISAYRPPVYPVLIGVLMKVNSSVQFIYIVQVFFNLGNIFMVRLIAGLIFPRGFARLSALVYAASLTPYLLSSALLTEIVFTLLMLIGVYFTVRAFNERLHRAAAMAGVAFGLASLTRSIAAPIPIGMALIALLFCGQGQRQTITTSALILVLITALTIAPWAIRNYHVLGEFVPIDTIGGLNLYLGNNPRSDGGFTDLTGDPLFEDEMSEPDRDRAMKAAALAHIKSRPLRFVWHTLKRFCVFWLMPTDWLHEVVASPRPWLHPLISLDAIATLSQLLCGFICLLGYFRRLLSGQWELRRLLIMAPIAYFTVVLSLFYIQARYRFPVMPLIGMFALELIVLQVNSQLNQSRTPTILIGRTSISGGG